MRGLWYERPSTYRGFLPRATKVWCGRSSGNDKLM